MWQPGDEAEEAESESEFSGLESQLQKNQDLDGSQSQEGPQIQIAHLHPGPLNSGM